MLAVGLFCAFIGVIGARTTSQVPANVSSTTPTQVPSATCPYHVISGTSFQECVSILGNLNTTALTHADKCSYYAESVYCTQRSVASTIDGACTLSDIQYWYHRIAAGFVDFGEINNCVVAAESGDLCTSQDRLASFALTSCRPYLESMPDTHCMLVNYLLKCVNKYTGYVHKSCTTSQVNAALGSSAGSAWIHQHYPAIDLTSCFNVQVHSTPPTTTLPPETRACVAVYDMFTNHGITNCLFYLRDINLTGSDAIPVKDGCSLINDALVCMQRVMHVSGSTCTMQQMHDTLAGMLHVSELLGPGKTEYVQQCAVDTSYATTMMCTDDFRLATFLTNTLVPTLHLVEKVSASLACSLLERSVPVMLDKLNVTCTSDELWSALTSPVGVSQLSVVAPKFDPHTCVVGSTTSKPAQTRACVDPNNC